MAFTSTLQINTDTVFASAYNDGPASVTSMSDGGFLIVQDHSTHVHSQVFSSAGVAGLYSHAFTTYTNQLDSQSAARMTNGSLVTLSRDADSLGFTIFNSTGTALVKATTDTGDVGSSNGKVAALLAGGFVIAYQDAFSATDADILARVYDNSGNLVTTIPVDTSTANETSPAVCGLADGGFVIAYETASEVHFRIYNSDFSPRGSETTIPSTGSINQRPAITALADGGFAIAYESNEWSTTDTDITFARFNSNGDLLKKTDVSLSADNDTLPSITALANGYVAIGSTNSEFGDTDPEITIVDPNTGERIGNLLNPNFAVNINENFSGVSGLTDGRLVSIFTDTGTGTVRGAILSFGARTWTSDGAGDSMKSDTSGFNADIMLGNGGADTLSGGGGGDTLRGGAGNDVLDGGLGFDLLNGGTGIDKASYRFFTGSTVVDLQEGEVSFPFNSLNVDTIQSIEDVETGNGSDTILGSDGANRLEAFGGNDVIEGAAGEDTLIGSGGNDTLRGGVDADTIYGGEGNDVLSGDAGTDRLRGGEGNDTYTATGTAEVVEFFGEGNDLVFSGVNFTLGANVERLTLVGGGDTRGTGNGLNNAITGTTGNNILRGGAGHDTLDGLAGNDQLFGDAGDDALSGKLGNDTLTGGAGIDNLSGGGGSDVFDFNGVSDSGIAIAASDVITGFDVLADKIDLSGIDAISGGGDNSFTLVAGGFTAAGQIRLQQSGANTILQLNVTGNSGAEMSVVLLGISPGAIGSEDFIL